MIARKGRTKVETEDILSRLDALVEAGDTSYISDLVKYQQAHGICMSKTYGRFMNQFEMYFCLLIEYSDMINYLEKKSWSQNRTMQFVIATYALKQLYSSYFLLHNGMYDDAMTISRSAYESFLRIVFISMYPDYSDNAYKTQGQKGTKFNATDLVKDHLGLEWNTYNITSAFAHSNMYDVMGALIEIGIEKKAKVINVSYSVDDEKMGLCINLLTFLSAAFLMMFDKLFTVDDFSSHKQRKQIQSVIDNLQTYSSISLESLSGHSTNKYWRQVAVDLEDIFKLLGELDMNRDENWKTIWKRIRVDD